MLLFSSGVFGLSRWYKLLLTCWIRSIYCTLGACGTEMAVDPPTGVCVCPRIDPLRFRAECRRRRLNQGLVVALDFLSVLDKACFFCVIVFVSGCMLCLRNDLLCVEWDIKPY